MPRVPTFLLGRPCLTPVTACNPTIQRGIPDCRTERGPPQPAPRLTDTWLSTQAQTLPGKRQGLRRYPSLPGIPLSPGFPVLAPSWKKPVSVAERGPNRQRFRGQEGHLQPCPLPVPGSGV